MTARSSFGSRWWRCDFHTHTPASSCWRGAPADDEESWLRHAMQAGLDCVVVTDHNSGEWVERLADKRDELAESQARPSWFRSLVLFPGAEITVTNGAARLHLLAIFEPGTSRDRVVSVLGACGITSDFGDSEASFAQVNLEGAARIVRQHRGLPVAAHALGPRGLLQGASGLSPSLKSALEQVVAIEVIEPSDKPSFVDMAVVRGSDAHKVEDLGQRSTWIKMSEPSLDGLRVALMDHELCVRNQDEDPNHTPGVHLERLTISQMAHCGRVNPLDVYLHPNLTAIIGGRGTGKSTLVEAARLASRRGGELKGELEDGLARFSSTAHGVVLKGQTEVLLELVSRHRRYRLRWREDGQLPSIELEGTGGEWQPVDDGSVAPGDLPLRIFSQKQINQLSGDPGSLLALIDDSLGEVRTEWQHRWEQECSNNRQLRERERALEGQLGELPRTRRRLAELDEDLRRFEEGGHREVLVDYQRRRQQRASIPDQEDFGGLAEDLRIKATELALSDVPAHLFAADDASLEELRHIYSNTETRLSRIGADLQRIASELESLTSEHRHALEQSSWSAAVEAAVGAYRELVQGEEAPPDTDSYREWTRQRGELQEKVVELESLQHEQQQARQQLDESQITLLGLRAELYEERRAYLEQAIGDSDHVRMELVPWAEDVAAVERKLREILVLDDQTFRASILDEDGQRGLLWPVKEWSTRESGRTTSLVELIAELKSRVLAVALGDATGVEQRFASNLQRKMENDPSFLDSLMVWWPEDLLKVRYSRGDGHWEPLHKGSAGQRASAILAFILSHGDEPLILDQPEDDLDNALITDMVVRSLHELKQRRQVVVVTHNPNIVVNGDAEWVLGMHMRRGQVEVEVSGGLQESDVRDAICDVMEGGRDALEKRYARMTQGRS